MGHLSTHVLDTVNGRPAAGMSIALYRLDAVTAMRVGQWSLNADGRTDGPLLQGNALQPGAYRLIFEVADYFRAQGIALPDPPFLGSVPIDFGIADPTGRYHVPLLASPWAYSTYRGS